MRKMISGVLTLLSVTVVFAVLPAVSSAKPTLCEKGCGGGAEEYAKKDAEYYWGRGSGREHFGNFKPCKGPYENVYKKTQWACFGNAFTFDFSHQLEWQVNLDPYHNVTFATAHVLY